MNTIGLSTCWYNGCSQAAALDQEIKELLGSISNINGIDMLLPLGSLAINQNSESSAENSLEFKDEDDIWDATHHPSSQSISIGESGAEMDLEDLISTPNANGLEAPIPSPSMYLTIEAQDGTEKKVHNVKGCQEPRPELF